MPKTDQIEYQKRIMAVQSWIIDGIPPTIIVQQILLKGWSKSDRHAYRILKAARLKWIAHEDESIEEKRKLHIQKLTNRIRGMSNEYKNTPKGMNTILAYEREIAKLEGLYHNPFRLPEVPAMPDLPMDTTQFINDSSDIDYTKLSDDVLDAIIADLKKEVV